VVNLFKKICLNRNGKQEAEPEQLNGTANLKNLMQK